MTSDLNNIFKAIADNYGFDGNTRKLPPVDLWNPEYCGDIGLEIRRDGSWWQDGIRITREKLIQLFATILRKDDDGKTYLVTPHEKVIIKVEDAHFIIIRADKISGDLGDEIMLTTNVGDVFMVDAQHKIWLEFNDKGEPRPYVIVRGQLNALISRSVFYELIGWANEIDGNFVLKSSGHSFSLGSYL